jgi:hypothetical protein
MTFFSQLALFAFTYNVVMTRLKMPQNLQGSRIFNTPSENLTKYGFDQVVHREKPKRLLDL